MDKIKKKKRLGLNLVKTIQKNDFINFIDFFVSLKKVFILNAKFKEGYVLDISYFLSKDLRFYNNEVTSLLALAKKHSHPLVSQILRAHGAIETKETSYFPLFYNLLLNARLLFDFKQYSVLDNDYIGTFKILVKLQKLIFDNSKAGIGLFSHYLEQLDLHVSEIGCDSFEITKEILSSRIKKDMYSKPQTLLECITEAKTKGGEDLNLEYKEKLLAKRGVKTPKLTYLYKQASSFKEQLIDKCARSKQIKHI